MQVIQLIKEYTTPPVTYITTSALLPQSPDQRPMKMTFFYCLLCILYISCGSPGTLNGTTEHVPMVLQSTCANHYNPFYTGICQSFIGPSNTGTCAGQQITFTCVVESGVTSWIITPGGEAGVCSYSSYIPDEDTCGPGRRFTSFPTEESNNPLNSSLSVAVTDDLNVTLVQCADATVVGDLTGSYNICLIGKFKCLLVYNNESWTPNR